MRYRGSGGGAEAEESFDDDEEDEEEEEDQGGRGTPMRTRALDEELEQGGGVNERMVDSSGWRGW